MSGKHDSNLPDVTLDAEPPRTLRDEFALAAFAAAMGRETVPLPENLAANLYMWADAMMDERRKARK